MGLFSSVMGSFNKEDELKKKMADTAMSDPMKRQQMAREIEQRRQMSMGDKIMEGAGQHFMGKAANLGFGGDGFSMQTMMDAQKGRESLPVAPVQQMTAPSFEGVLMPQMPQQAMPMMMSQAGPSPALMSIYSGIQANQQGQMPMTGGILPLMSVPDPNKALNVDSGNGGKRDMLMRMMMG